MEAEKKRNAKQIILNARKYWQVLQTGDASMLLALSSHRRRHSMESLACLSKFLGQYDDWCQIRKKFQLKWTKETSVEFFERIYESDQDFDSMLDWLKKAISICPPKYANVLRYMTLTGLRPSEALYSISLIHSTRSTSHQGYYNKDRLTLEHFRFPDLFIRTSKMAYISVVNDRVLDIALSAEKDLNYYRLRSWLVKRGLSAKSGNCRKIFGTFMRASAGLQSEMVDVLQGRAPKTIFARHYFKPSGLDFRDKVIKGLEGLEQKIMTK